MVSLDGSDVLEIVDSEIENNKIDDFEDTMDLTSVVEEVLKNV